MRLLDLEQRRDEVAQHFPLVQPQAVHHDEQHAACVLEDGHEELGPDVHRQRRAVALGGREPAGVLARDVGGEAVVEAALQRAQRVAEAGLARGLEPHLPPRQLHHQLDPFAPRERLGALRFQLAEPRHEVARPALLADAVALEQPRHHGQHLPRVDRLDEVVVHLDADRLAQRAVALALRHHHDRHGGVDRADLAQQLEAAPAGHLLVQQHDAVRLPPQQRQRVVAVRRRRHGKALLFEEAAVRGEPFDLVVHPENALRTLHRGES